MSYVWWPDMDADIELKVKNCHQCKQNQKCPTAVPMKAWEWPAQPWSRIHIDYCDPFQGKCFWWQLMHTPSGLRTVWLTQLRTSTTTIWKLRSVFPSYGLPRVVVYDNGSVFTSSEFQGFMTKNGIHSH